MAFDLKQKLPGKRSQLVSKQKLAAFRNPRAHSLRREREGPGPFDEPPWASGVRPTHGTRSPRLHHIQGAAQGEMLEPASCEAFDSLTKKRRTPSGLVVAALFEWISRRKNNLCLEYY